MKPFVKIILALIVSCAAAFSQSTIIQKKVILEILTFKVPGAPLDTFNVVAPESVKVHGGYRVYMPDSSGHLARLQDTSIHLQKRIPNILDTAFYGQTNTPNTWTALQQFSVSPIVNNIQITVQSPTDANINLNRGSMSSGAGILHRTAGTLKWYSGIRATGTNDYRWYNYMTGSDGMILDSLNNLTVAGGISIAGVLAMPNYGYMAGGIYTDATLKAGMSTDNYKGIKFRLNNVEQAIRFDSSGNISTIGKMTASWRVESPSYYVTSSNSGYSAVWANTSNKLSLNLQNADRFSVDNNGNLIAAGVLTLNGTGITRLKSNSAQSLILFPTDAPVATDEAFGIHDNIGTAKFYVKWNGEAIAGGVSSAGIIKADNGTGTANVRANVFSITAPGDLGRGRFFWRDDLTRLQFDTYNGTDFSNPLYLYSTGGVQLDGAVKLLANTTIASTKQIGSDSATPGVMGTGWLINQNATIPTQSYMEIDNIRVRNNFQTHYFTKDVIKTIGNKVFMTRSGVIGKDDAAADERIWLTSAKSDPLVVGDLIEYRDGEGAFVQATVNQVVAQGPTYDTYRLTFTSGSYSDFHIGGVVAVVSGSSILLDASQPTIDVYASVTAFTDLSSSAKVKFRAGNLGGMTFNGQTITAGTYGMLTTDGYFSGQIVSGAGNIGGWRINPGSITKANSSGKFTGMRAPNSAGDFVFFAGGNDTTGQSAPFRVASDGTVYATAIYLSGYIPNGSAADDINNGSTTINGGRITTNTVTASQLNFTPVSSTDVVARINASAEGLQISGAKIAISGATTFAAGYDPTSKTTSSDVTTIIGNTVTTTYLNSKNITALGSVTAGTFNLGSGKFQVASDGTLTATGATISGNVTASSINLSTATITGTLSVDKISAGTLAGFTFVSYNGSGLTAWGGIGSGTHVTYDNTGMHSDGFNVGYTEFASWNSRLTQTDKTNLQADINSKTSVNDATVSTIYTWSSDKIAGALTTKLATNGVSLGTSVATYDMYDDISSSYFSVSKRPLIVNGSSIGYVLSPN